MDENKRRFSLEKTELDPALLNRIMSADGDDQLGEWDGESIQDLVDELERIEEREAAGKFYFRLQFNLIAVYPYGIVGYSDNDVYMPSVCQLIDNLPPPIRVKFLARKLHLKNHENIRNRDIL